MKSKASSSRFKNLFFSTYYWGSISLPIVILYRTILCKATCISSLQSVQLKVVRIRGTIAEESIFMYAEQSIPQEATYVPGNNTVKTKFNLKSCQFQAFPPRHVHFLRVRHTYRDFSGRIQSWQGKNCRIYVEAQLLLVYNGNWKRLAASLNKDLIPC